MVNIHRPRLCCKWAGREENREKNSDEIIAMDFYLFPKEQPSALQFLRITDLVEFYACVCNDILLAPSNTEILISQSGWGLRRLYSIFANDCEYGA